MRTSLIAIVIALAWPPLGHGGDDLLFHVDFNGTVKATKANGNNTPLRQPEPATFVPGVAGQAVLLNTEEIVYARDRNVNLPTGTILFWLKPSGWNPCEPTENHDWLFSLAGPGAEGDRLQFFKFPNPMLMYFMGKEGSVKQLGQNITDWKKNEWRFLAMAWNHQTMKLFVNGAPIGKVAITDANLAVNTGNEMRLQSTTRPWAFDELRIFSRALLDDEVREYYAKDAPRVAAAGGGSPESLCPRLTIPKTATPPQIDGRVEPAEWDHASTLGGFLGIPELLLNDRQTAVKLCYDEQNLYLQFTSPVPAKPRADATTRDSAVYTDDSCEILLATSLKPDAEISQLVFNTRDTHYDGRGGKADWNPEWTSRSSVDRGVWTAEVGIPLASLGVTPKEGDEWRFNFGRNLRDPDKFSNPIFALAYSELKSFGYLRFGASQERVQADLKIQEANGQVAVSVAALTPSPAKLRTVVELKKAAQELRDRFQLPTFERLKGSVVFRKEGGPPTPGQAPLQFTVQEKVEGEGEYFLRTQVLDGDRPLFSQVVPFLFKKPFVVELTPRSKDQRLMVRWELRRNLGDEIEVECELQTESGKKVQSRHERVTGKTNGDLVFDIAALKELRYRLVTKLRCGGREFAETSDFPCFKNAEWIGFAKTLAGQHLVPRPWVPIKTTDAEIQTLTQTYRFPAGPLPEQIVVQGQPILAAPARLGMQANGKEAKASGNRQWVENHPDRVRFRQGASLAGATVTIEALGEFDGMLRYDVTFEPPRRDFSLEKLVLEIPIKPEFATLKYPCRGRYQQWSVMDLEGEVKERYADYFMPHLWVGNDEKGLAWFAESDERYSVAKPEQTVELIKEPSRTLLRITMVDQPVALNRRTTYTFGLMATPPRPAPENWFALRYASCVSTPKVQITTGYTTGPEYHVKMGIPWPALDPERFKASVRDAHAYPGGKIQSLVYTTCNGAGDNFPEFHYFEQEWKNAAACDTWFFASRGFYYWGTCPTSETWRDFFLWSCARAIAEYDIDGLYYDYGTAMESVNPTAGCGYERNGKTLPTYPIFADRELRKMIYTLFCEKKGAAYFVLHNYSQMMAPLASFATLHLDAESYQQRTGKVGAKLTDDYTKLISLPRLRAMFGTQFGTTPYFLPELTLAEKDSGAEWHKRATRAMIALLLPHGIPIWGFNCEIPELNQYVSVEDKFGFEKSAFVPYFRQTGEVRADPAREKVLVSYWKKPGDLLVVVGNLEEQPFQGALVLDPAKLFPGTAGALQACEGYSGKALPTQNNRITIAVPTKDYLLVWATLKK